jgi:hypothetical protein
MELNISTRNCVPCALEQRHKYAAQATQETTLPDLSQPNEKPQIGCLLKERHGTKPTSREKGYNRCRTSKDFLQRLMGTDTLV